MITVFALIVLLLIFVATFATPHFEVDPNYVSHYDPHQVHHYYQHHDPHADPHYDPHHHDDHH